MIENNSKNAGLKLNRVTLRALSYLAHEQVRGNGWIQKQRLLTRWLGRNAGHAEIEAAVTAGLIEERRTREGKRGPATRYLRATPAGLRAWIEAVAPSDEA